MLFYKKDIFSKNLYFKIAVQLFSILMCAIILITYKNLNDPDAYWHIKNGEWIFNNNKIPMYDVFSWFGVENNLKWVNHEWLFDVFIYLNYRFFGLKGVVSLVPIVAVILYLLVTRLCYIRTKNAMFSVLFGFFIMIGINGYMVPRPQILSYCLFILFCILMENKKYLYVIPIIIVGTNLHGGVYPVYLILAAYYMFQEMDYKSYIKYIMLYTLLVIINPYGYHTYLYTIKVLSYNEFSEYISEWIQVTPAQNIGLLASYIFLVISTRKAAIIYKDAAFILAFAVLSLFSWRHVAFLYLFCFTIASKYILNELIKFNKRLESFSNYCKKYPMLNFKPVSVKFPSIPFWIVLILVLGVFLYMGNRIYTQKSVIGEKYPVEAVAFIKANNIQRIYNNYNFGGFLIFNGIPTMIDGRADLFTSKFNSTNFYREYIEIAHLKKDYEDFFAKYNIQNLLLYKKENLSMVLRKDNNFKLIYEDKDFNIFTLNKR